MDHASNPEADNTHPNPHDYAPLASIYSHLDSTTTIGACCTARFERVVAREQVETSIFVTRFADGSSLITLIIWAADRAEREGARALGRRGAPHRNRWAFDP